MGELARKPGAPGLPMTPEDLLTAEPGCGYSWIEKNIPPVLAVAVAVLGPSLLNWQRNRPFFAGIYRHVIYGATAYVGGSWLWQSRLAQKAEKDAILLDYISLHPEDFPPIERKRYKDIFAPWSPRR